MRSNKLRPKPLRHDRSAEGSHNAGRRKQPAAVPLPQDRVIFGLHASEAALANPHRRIKHAYLTENAAAKLGALVAGRAVAVTPAHPPDLDALLGERAVHQGVVLHVEPLPQPSLGGFLDGMPDGAGAVIAMLDQVTDPHNVGAVLRSAAAFDIAALIVQDRHSPPLSGTLAKAASGALEHVPVIATVNLARALGDFKRHGFRCVGFDSEAGGAFDAAAMVDSRVVLVFGAEDRGLRRLVREECDTLYALAVTGAIKSLNVSNAAAIAFYEAVQARRRARDRG
jgi:23S rRNA (guanosine2251-2'-O)-methyltransferase